MSKGVDSTKTITVELDKYMSSAYAANLAFTWVEVDRRSGGGGSTVGRVSRHKLLHATSAVIYKKKLAYN